MRASALSVLAGVALIPAPAAQAQGLPRACYEIAASVPQLPNPPRPTIEFQERLFRSVAPSAPTPYARTAAPPERLDSLWAADSGMAALALAQLISDPIRFPLELRSPAAARYAKLSGAPFPILYVAAGIMDPRVWELALRSIRRPLAPNEETLVFFWACNAAWELTAFGADTLFAKAWRANPETLWPADAVGLIRAATPLIRGPLAPAMQALLRSHVPDSIPFVE